MTTNENSTGFPSPPGKAHKGTRVSLHPLHEAALRLADLGLNRSRSKTKDLVGSLLCHGARAWRYSQPMARIHLHVTIDGGSNAVRLRLRLATVGTARSAAQPSGVRRACAGSPCAACILVHFLARGARVRPARA